MHIFFTDADGDRHVYCFAKDFLGTGLAVVRQKYSFAKDIFYSFILFIFIKFIFGSQKLFSQIRIKNLLL